MKKLNIEVVYVICIDSQEEKDLTEYNSYKIIEDKVTKHEDIKSNSVIDTKSWST